MTLIVLNLIPFKSSASLELEDKVAFFEENKESLQPWKAHKSLPTSIKEAGLGEDFELFDSASFGDGGSVYWIIRDKDGHYFAFWKGPEHSWDDEKNQSISLGWNERPFWIGTTHPGYYKGGVQVPYNSRAEQFLSTLITKIYSNQSAHRTPVSAPRQPLPYRFGAGENE